MSHGTTANCRRPDRRPRPRWPGPEGLRSEGEVLDGDTRPPGAGIGRHRGRCRMGRRRTAGGQTGGHGHDGQGQKGSDLKAKFLMAILDPPVPALVGTEVDVAWDDGELQAARPAATATMARARRAPI